MVYFGAFLWKLMSLGCLSLWRSCNERKILFACSGVGFVDFFGEGKVYIETILCSLSKVFCVWKFCFNLQKCFVYFYIQFIPYLGLYKLSNDFHCDLRQVLRICLITKKSHFCLKWVFVNFEFYSKEKTKIPKPIFAFSSVLTRQRLLLLFFFENIKFYQTSLCTRRKSNSWIITYNYDQ